MVANQAIRACRAFAEHELVWVQEPIIPDELEGHPITTGENLHSLYEFQKLIAAARVSFPEPDVSNCGEVTVFLKVSHIAKVFNYWDGQRIP